MKTHLDCFPCFLRQTLDSARLVTDDPAEHERILRRVLAWASEMDMNDPPPLMGMRIQRMLREIARTDDPYRIPKKRFNAMARAMMPAMEALIRTAADPLATAVRMAIAGNVIDLGPNAGLTLEQARDSIESALEEPFAGDPESLRQAVAEARRILYLADNAGEIFFDRLLIEQLPQERVALVVRGAPVLNDATTEDARAAGLDEIVEVLDNGADVPGTVLGECSADFRKRFAEADLILAKGMGNYETLSGRTDKTIFFLFKVKCPVVAAHAGLPLGTHALLGPTKSDAAPPPAQSPASLISAPRSSSP